MGLRALRQAARGAVISTVNVKFLRFTYGLTIALVVGLLTLGSLAGIAYKLITTCELTCNSIPLALLSLESVSDLSCVGFKTRGMSLSQLPGEQSQQVFNTTQAPNQMWNQFAWTASAATLGKCSFLHGTSCGLLEWLATFQGLVALSTIGSSLGSPSSIASAPWPTLTGQSSLYSSQEPLDGLIASTFSASHGSLVRMTSAAVNSIITAGGSGGFTGTADVTLLASPDTAACCDVSTNGSRLGQFGGGSSRFVLQVKGRQVANMSLSSCGAWGSSTATATRSATARCSWVEISATMVMPPPNIVNASLCSYYDQPTNSFQMPIALSTSICQLLGYDASNKSAPNQICLNGTISNYKVLVSDYFTITGSCPAAPAPVTARAVPKPWAAQQLVATQLLLPLAHEFGAGIAAYLAAAEVDVASAAQGLNAIKTDNEAASWWMENSLYCCSKSCNGVLSSIGSALGYEAYVEGAIAMLVILLYLAFNEVERRRLQVAGLKGVYDIAFETDDSNKESDEPQTQIQPKGPNSQQATPNQQVIARSHAALAGKPATGFSSGVVEHKGSKAAESQGGVAAVSAWAEES